MRAGDWQAALRALPRGTLGDIVGTAPFLVLSPHPDDETLGCGGLIALAAAASVPAHVTILTDGAASHRASAAYPPARLAGLRRREAEAATARLGLPAGHLAFLGLPDAAAPMAGPAFEAAVDAIVDRATNAGARTLLVTSPLDPHCDHEAAFAMAVAALPRLDARLWTYPVWSLHRPPDTEIEAAAPRGLRLPIGPVRDAKHAAIRLYASQMTRLIDDDPDGFCFTPDELAPFLLDAETFIEVVR